MLAAEEGMDLRGRELYLEGFEDSGSFKSLVRGVGGGFAPVTVSSQHYPLPGKTGT